MAFSKKTYVSGQTAITADNLNAIQDELIRVGGSGTLPVADYVVEQGTIGNWTYRKWNSGVAECWGKPSQSVASSGTFLGANAFAARFPVPAGLFTSVTEVNVNPRIGTEYAIPAYINVLDTTISIEALSNSSGTQTLSAHISVKGKWK